MQILFTILYILLFIVCLSILIMIHELGHLAAAKAFKVYCFEYSIGFGPKLFSRKRKNGETYFSLRAIPFGGFVSMYGEDVPLPEGMEIPPERSLDNIKKWKRGIILVAGVTMNAILALVVFFIANIAFEQVSYSLNPVTVSETSILKDDITNKDIIQIKTEEKTEKGKTVEVPVYVSNCYVISDNATVTKYDDTIDEKIYVLLNPAIQGKDKLDWSYMLQYATVGEDNKATPYEPNANTKNIVFNLAVSKFEEGVEEKDWPVIDVPVTLKCLHSDDKHYFESPGISITEYRYWLKGKAFGKTFVDFGNSSTAIVRAFGSLFVSQEARDSMGGIIAIGFETTNILKNFGIESFLRVWAMVSVNLAIVNLFPFPGLDGWQLLVLIVEGVSKKKIPDKVKNIVSLVGLVLLFGLMILLVFKDVFKYII